MGTKRGARSIQFSRIGLALCFVIQSSVFAQTQTQTENQTQTQNQAQTEIQSPAGAPSTASPPAPQAGAPSVPQTVAPAEAQPAVIPLTSQSTVTTNPTNRFPKLFYPNCGADPNIPEGATVPSGTKIIWGPHCERIDVSKGAFGQGMYDFQALEYKLKACMSVSYEMSQDKDADKAAAGALGANCATLKQHLSDFEDAQNEAQHCVDTQEPKSCVGDFLPKVAQIETAAFKNSDEIDKQITDLGKKTEATAQCPTCADPKTIADIKDATCCGYLKEREGEMSPQACTAFFNKKADIGTCAFTFFETIKNSVLSMFTSTYSLIKGVGSGLASLWNHPLASIAGAFTGLGQLAYEMGKDPVGVAKRILDALLLVLRDSLGIPKDYNKCFADGSTLNYGCQAAGSLVGIVAQSLTSGAIFDLLKGATETARVAKFTSEAKAILKERGRLAKPAIIAKSTTLFAGAALRATMRNFSATVRFSKSAREGLGKSVEEMVAKMDEKQAEYVAKKAGATKALAEAQRYLKDKEHQLEQAEKQKPSGLSKLLGNAKTAEEKKTLEVTALKSEIEKQRSLVKLMENDYTHMREKIKRGYKPVEDTAQTAGNGETNIAEALTSAEENQKIASDEFNKAISEVNKNYQLATNRLQLASKNFNETAKKFSSIANKDLSGKIPSGELRAPLDAALSEYQSALKDASAWETILKEKHVQYPDRIPAPDTAAKMISKASEDMKNSTALINDEVKKGSVERSLFTSQKAKDREALYKEDPMIKKTRERFESSQKVFNEATAKVAEEKAAQQAAEAATKPAAAEPSLSKKQIELATEAHDRALADSALADARIKRLNEFLADTQKASKKKPSLARDKNLDEAHREILQHLDIKKQADQTALAYKEFVGKQATLKDSLDASKVSALKGLDKQVNPGRLERVSSLGSNTRAARIFGVLPLVNAPGSLVDGYRRSGSEGAPPRELPPGAPTDGVAKPFTHHCLTSENLSVCANRIFYSAWYIANDPNAKPTTMVEDLKEELPPAQPVAAAPAPAPKPGAIAAPAVAPAPPPQRQNPAAVPALAAPAPPVPADTEPEIIASPDPEKANQPATAPENSDTESSSPPNP